MYDFLHKEFKRNDRNIKASKMRKLVIYKDLRIFLLPGIGIVTFSNFLVTLFGQTIPNIVWSFFKDVGVMVIVLAVFVFAVSWVLKSRPVSRPENYSVMIYDVFGNESNIDGIRTQFKTHDVAWSFMKYYKKSFSLYNFALVANVPKEDKKTIYRYI